VSAYPPIAPEMARGIEPREGSKIAVARYRSPATLLNLPIDAHNGLGTPASFTKGRSGLLCPMERKSMASKKKIAVKRRVWNKGLRIGKRDGFTPAQVKRIRSVLRDRGIAGVRDLALFSTAIDTMLHGYNLLTLVVGDVQSRNGSIRPLIEVAQTSGAPPVRCALSKPTTIALERWITKAGLKRTDYLFPGGARRVSRPMSGRQLSRLLKEWIVDAGFDATEYSIESLRRTKALHILRGTGDLQTVRALLGHVQIESTARYLGLKTKADPIAVCRAFDI
jgi:integrase